MVLIEFRVSFVRFIVAADPRPLIRPSDANTASAAMRNLISAVSCVHLKRQTAPEITFLLYILQLLSPRSLYFGFLALPEKKTLSTRMSKKVETSSSSPLFFLTSWYKVENVAL